MFPNSHIAEQDSLSQYRQICCVVFHMLEVAQAGGMSKKQAERTYHQLLNSYSTMKGSAFWLFREEIIRLLVTPDSDFDEGHVPKIVPSWGKN